jgi:glycine betaine/choline ABC-type transport system substrate-binding protein
MTRLRRAGVALAIALGLVLSGCGTDTRDSPGSTQPQGAKLRISIGTQEFPEALLLGEMWRQALSANGYVVDLRKGLGPTEVLDKALRAGSIDGYVAYTGTVLSIVAGEEVSGLDPETTYEQAARFYRQQGMTMTSMTPFQNRDAIATTRDFALRHRLRSIEDLDSVPGLRLGARPEFGHLYLGMVGLQEVYGLDRAQFVPIELGEVYAVLDEGEVDAGNVFTTDPELRGGNYQVLEDPELLFGSQNATMVVRTDKLESVGKAEFLAVIESVNPSLTESTMIDLNQKVTEGQSERRVAAQFLREQGLLGPVGDQD